MIKAGEKLAFEELGVQLVVTRGGDGDISVAAGGDDGGLKVGKRYEHPDSGIQVLVTRQAAATLLCNGAPMVLQAPKKTRSAD